MAISKFKATCLAVLERVRRTGEPVRITRFGRPVADIVPPAPPTEPESWLGALRGRGRVASDLIEPVMEASEWEALASSRKGRDPLDPGGSGRSSRKGPRR